MSAASNSLGKMHCQTSFFTVPSAAIVKPTLVFKSFVEQRQPWQILSSNITLKPASLVISSYGGNKFLSIIRVLDENMEAPLQAGAIQECSIMVLAAAVTWISRLGLDKVPEQVL